MRSRFLCRNHFYNKSLILVDVAKFHVDFRLYVLL
jgi:hypothetical protein